MRTLHLVDALPYVFRAYFSLPASLTDPAGQPVNAVRGFADFLLRLLAEERPTHVAVCFDESLTSSFRNDLYPDYKSGRELPPPELEAQLSRCRELSEAFGAATFADDRYEADDLIATLLHRHRRRGHGAVIVTSDKDLAQLVDERVTLYDFARGERLGPAEVAARFGVRPAQIPDYLGLAGDAVDSIPGVRGVGAKTAAALLGHFADLDALYAGLEAVPELPLRGARAVAERLAAGREAAFLSRELATLSREAPAKAGLRELAWKGYDRARLEALGEATGLKGLLARAERAGLPARRR
jgi:5'-3' exonuclease